MMILIHHTTERYVFENYSNDKNIILPDQEKKIKDFFDECNLEDQDNAPYIIYYKNLRTRELKIIYLNILFKNGRLIAYKMEEELENYVKPRIISQYKTYEKGAYFIKGRLIENG